MSGAALLALAHQQRVQAERAGIEISRALATAVDAGLRRSVSVLEALAVAPALDRGDMVGFNEQARRVLSTQPTWDALVLQEPSGRPLVHTRFPLGGKLPELFERESFDEVLQRHQPVIGFLARSSAKDLNVPVRVPVIRDGELRFVLTAVVSPAGIRELLGRQRLPQDWLISVFDARGARIARSRDHARYIGQPPAPTLKALMEGGGEEGAGMSTTLEGERVYTAYSRSRQSGWTVAIGMPPATVEAGAWRSLAALGGGILLSIALGALAALVVARSITRPIAELRDAARALGRREPLVPPSTSIEEIRQVGNSIATAADERTRGEAEREQLLEREQEARALAEAASLAKDQFLAMLGHELRNPLGAIANASQLLDDPRSDARTLGHARAVVHRQVAHLSRMTDDLLEAARAMTGKIVLHRTPIDLARSAAHVLTTVRAGAAEHRFVEALEPVWVNGDPTRIEQIIGNLVGNAVKYTPPGGTITVSVRREGAEAVLRVADDGVGMPPELVPRVFDPFVQGERSLDRAYGGLGIGLTLVRRLAELHGGSASAGSAGPDRGSEFTVRLPAAAAPSIAPAPASQAPVPARDILIVEDNEDARETLRKLLELHGHRVRVARDGVSALAAVRAEPPEFALIDIGLPRMDGYEVARRIRAELAQARAPVLVALTGYGLPEDRERTLGAGFQVHLVKPVDPAALDAVLRGAATAA